MHLLRHPRNAALLGIIFIVIAIIYFVVPTALGLDVAMLDIAAGRRRFSGSGSPWRSWPTSSRWGPAANERATAVSRRLVTG